MRRDLQKSGLKVAFLTREYPPENYGGAGVHVEHLTRELLKRVDLDVHCFGSERSAPEVRGVYPPWSALDGAEPELAALRTLSVDLAMVRGVKGRTLLHSHTWYANWAGHLGKLAYGVPHVMTSHSLEPLRPWKAEQLGGGYAISSFIERTAIEAADAVIAVSRGMREDILRAYPGVDAERVQVIYNGVDPEGFRPTRDDSALVRYGIEPGSRYVVFLGRITRQKGLVHLLRAARWLAPGAGLVLCAGGPDTPEIGEEVRALVEQLQRERQGVIWIEKMLPREDIVGLLSHCSAFCCPSVYEPFGIVNLEAMACGAPVVASHVGGIPEIVVPDVTGYLVPFESDGTPRNEPRDPELFARDLAGVLNRAIASPELTRALGQAGRARVVETFSWSAIADQTLALYERLVGR